MKTILTIMITVIISLNSSKSYSTCTSTLTDDTSKRIEQIRAQYKLINESQMKYRLSERDLMGESTEGGSIASFSDAYNLVKLIATYYGETGKSVREYYFNHGELFFAFIREYHYNKPIDQVGSKVESVKEDRYYFFHQNMIRWLQGSNLQNPNNVSYKNEALNLLNESKKLSNYISNCKSTDNHSITKDTLRCKYGSDCPSTGYILKGSRNSCGEAIHVSPKNKKVPLEQ